jgi:ribonuclease P protein component
LPVAGTRGYDYVLVARAGTLDRSWPALLDDLRKALEALAPKGREAG